MIDFQEEELTLLPNQGHCNQNFLLEKDGKKYHVRKYKLADRDRAFEYKAQKLASKRGIAAKPFYRDDSIMIGEFIEGVHKEKLSKKEIRQLALVVKKLHKLKIRQKPLRLPKEFERKVQHLPKELVFSHGDLSVKNILFANGPIMIDWEYASLGDKYFDLASVCQSFAFSKADERYFLRAYGGKIDAKKLVLYKEIFWELSKQWFDKLAKGELIFN